MVKDRARPIDSALPSLFVHFRAEFAVRAGFGCLPPPFFGGADDGMDRTADSGPAAVALSDYGETVCPLPEAGAWRVPLPALGGSRHKQLGQPLFANRRATERGAGGESVPHFEVHVEARGDRLGFAAGVPAGPVEADGTLGSRAAVGFVPQTPTPIELAMAHLRLEPAPKGRLTVTGEGPLKNARLWLGEREREIHRGGRGKALRRGRGERGAHGHPPGSWKAPHAPQRAILGAFGESTAPGSTGAGERVVLRSRRRRRRSSVSRRQSAGPGARRESSKSAERGKSRGA